MYRFIWLVPLLPLIGAAINGLLGRAFRFSERTVTGIAVGTVALSFLIALAAVYSYGFGGEARFPGTYVTSEDGAFKYSWIPGGTVRLTQGVKERAALAPQPNSSVLNVEWSYQLDPLSAIFMLVVTGVGL